jgi:hypothetical protein
MDKKTCQRLEHAFEAFRKLVKEGHKRITLEWTENGPIVCCTSIKPVDAQEVDLIVSDEGAAMKWVPKGSNGVAAVPMMIQHPKRMERALRRGRKKLGL